jgi:hypothetical protein
MTDTALLLKEVEGLPDDCMPRLFAVIDELKHQAAPPPDRFAEDDLDETLEELWKLCKDVPISVDSFLDERHAETEREEAKYRA